MSIDQWSSMDTPSVSLTGVLNDLLGISGSEVEVIQVSAGPSPLDLGVGVIIRQPTMVDVNRVGTNLDVIFKSAQGAPFINALSERGMNMSTVSQVTDSYLTGVDPVAPPNTPSASVGMVVEGMDLPIKYSAMLALQMTACSMIGCNQSTTTVTPVPSYDGPGALLNFTFYETDPAQRVAAFSAINASDARYQANTHGMAGAVTSIQPIVSTGGMLPSPASAADNTLLWAAVGSAGAVALVGAGGGYMYWRHRRALRAAAKYEPGLGAGEVNVTPKVWRGVRRRLLL